MTNHNTPNIILIFQRRRVWEGWQTILLDLSFDHTEERKDKAKFACAPKLKQKHKQKTLAQQDKWLLEGNCEIIYIHSLGEELCE